MTDSSLERLRGIATLASWFGIFGIFSGLSIIAYQIYHWLKFDAWSPKPVRSFFEWAGINYLAWIDSNWLGLQKIELWVLSLPLSVAFLVIGFAFGRLAFMLLDMIAKEEFSRFQQSL